MSVVTAFYHKPITDCLTKLSEVKDIKILNQQEWTESNKFRSVCGVFSAYSPKVKVLYVPSRKTCEGVNVENVRA